MRRDRNETGLIIDDRNLREQYGMPYQEAQSRKNMIVFSGCKIPLKDKGIDVSFLPPKTKYYFNIQNLGGIHNEIKLVVIEEAPRMRTIRVDKERNYYLSFPYIEYIYMSYHNEPFLFVYFRNNPIENLDDMLFEAMLYNVFGFGDDVCFGDITIDNRIMSFKQETQAWIEAFWTSEFQKDAINSYIDFEKWEKESQKDKSFILHKSWQEVGTIKERIISIVSYVCHVAIDRESVIFRIQD